jgi:hypothetical protein
MVVAEDSAQSFPTPDSARTPRRRRHRDHVIEPLMSSLSVVVLHVLADGGLDDNLR